MGGDVPPLHRGGIDVRCLGTAGVDFSAEALYHDPAIDGRRLLYVRSTTQLALGHNARNSIQYTDSGNGFAVRWDLAPAGWNVTAESGTIRARIDGDLHWGDGWIGDLPNGSTCSRGGEGNSKLAARAFVSGAPFTVASLTYPDGTPVVGAVGPAAAPNFSDPHVRGKVYWRGVRDLHGDEWHRLTFGDDDGAWRSKVECVEFGDRFASDGGVQDLIVDPLTPAIAFSKTSTEFKGDGNSTAGQWYTTPPRAYFIPRVYTQTTYLTNGVDIRFSNIMSTAAVWFRLNTTGEWIQADPANPLRSDSFPQGTTLLQFYYNASHVRNRTVVKDPPHPSLTEPHGDLWWRDRDERDRMLLGGAGGVSPARAAVLAQLRKDVNSSHPEMDARFGRAERAGSPSLGDALLGVVDGWGGPSAHGYYAKQSLLDSVLDIDQAGNELFDQVALPSKELEFYGYYEVDRAIAAAGVYDLLAAHFRSDQAQGGLTPIEDYKIRDVLARRAHQSTGYLTGLYNQFYCQEWVNKTASSGQCEVPVPNTAPDPSPQPWMWSAARMAGVVATLFAMPSYDTPYYGTAGVDGTPARFPWTPSQKPATWLDLVVNQHDGGYALKMGALKGYPSQRVVFNQLEGGLVTNNSDPWGPGNWYDRAGYFGYPLMGHTMQTIAHLLSAKLDLHLPLLETAFNRSLNGDLRPHKYPQEFSHEYYPSVLLINARFPTLAPQALRNLNNTSFQREHNITGDDANLAKQVWIAGVLAALWYDPDYASNSLPIATCGDGAQSGREPCDGSDFGSLGKGPVGCSKLGPLWLHGDLDCHDCRIITLNCTAAAPPVPVAGGIN